MEKIKESACSVLVESRYCAGIFGLVHHYVAYYELSLCLLQPHMRFGDPKGRQLEADCIVSVIVIKEYFGDQGHH